MQKGRTPQSPAFLRKNTSALYIFILNTPFVELFCLTLHFKYTTCFGYDFVDSTGVMTEWGQHCQLYKNGTVFIHTGNSDGLGHGQLHYYS